jgi:hypothetical protein
LKHFVQHVVHAFALLNVAHFQRASFGKFRQRNAHVFPQLAHGVARHGVTDVGHVPDFRQKQWNDHWQPLAEPVATARRHDRKRFNAHVGIDRSTTGFAFRRRLNLGEQRVRQMGQINVVQVGALAGDAHSSAHAHRGVVRMQFTQTQVQNV